MMDAENNVPETAEVSPFAAWDRQLLLSEVLSTAGERGLRLDTIEEIRERIDTTIHAGQLPGVDYVKVPAMASVEEAYTCLGYKYSRDLREWVLEGVWRRLNAAVKSIRSRGFFDRQMKLVGSRFVWESERGHWKSRHWRVEGDFALADDGRVKITNAVIFVKGLAAEQEGRIEWSGFTCEGGALNSLVARRLYEVLGVIGARLICKKVVVTAMIMRGDLTDEEYDRRHDIHPSPVFALLQDGHRVVLYDNEYGQAWLKGDTESPIVADLIRAAVEYLIDRRRSK